MDGNLGDGGARGLGARVDGALVLELAHVDGVNVNILQDLNELVDTVEIAVELAGVVMGRINFSTKVTANSGQILLQPLVQIDVYRSYHEVNAYAIVSQDRKRCDGLEKA